MLEGVPDWCTKTCVTACVAGNKVTVVKVEEGSYIPEEQDPLALTVPATKAEQEVCCVQYLELPVVQNHSHKDGARITQSESVAGYGLCSQKFSLTF